MKSSKAIKLLTKLTEKNKRKFRKFIESPYFNENTSLVRLFYFIESFQKEDYEDEELNYETAFYDLYPDDNFNKSTIIKLLSKLYQLLQAFLLHQRVDTHSLKGKLDLLSEYLDLNETDLFESLQKEVERFIRSDENLDQEFYYHLFEYEGHVASYQSMKGIRKGDVNLQKVNLALDKYYIVSKLYHLCLMKNRERIINYQYEYTFLDQILKFIGEKSELKEDPVISTWKSALDFLQEPKNKNIYYELKAKKDKYRLFSQEDARAIYTFLENGTRNLFGDGKERFQELMDLYKMQLESGVMYFHGLLHKNILKNIVTVAINCEQLDWAKNLLTGLKDDGRIRIFPEEQALMVYNYNMASVLFHLKEFEDARQLLYAEEFNDVFYKLDAYVLLMEIRYETKDFHEIESFINKFRVFVHRSKELMDPRKEVYRNFLNIYELLYKTARESDSKKRSSLLTKLLRKLDSAEYIYEQDWFESKVKEIRAIDE